MRPRTSSSIANRQKEGSLRLFYLCKLHTKEAIAKAHWNLRFNCIQSFKEPDEQAFGQQNKTNSCM